MRIEVVPTVGEIKHEQIANKVVIMIDVLRASSTVVTALANGCPEVIPVETTGQALGLRADDTLLVGERFCKKPSAFHLNNSPTSLCQAEHHGKRLILTTTNGTRAIQRAERAHTLLIGCLLNATACITHALSCHLDITLYCAGSRDEFALEDGLAAGAMLDRAISICPQLQICDLGLALRACYQHLAEQLSEQLYATTTGKRLARNHFQDDIRFCGQLDLYPLVPIVKEGRILPVPVS